MPDVVVVGAGLSGLMAARRVKEMRGPASVIVLEGRNRIGGRMVRREVEAATGRYWIDLGGQWVGPTQTGIRGLATEFRLDLFEQYDEGNTVVWYDGRRYLADGDVPAPSEPDGKAAEDLSKLLSEVADVAVPDAAAPWASSFALAYDRITLAEWIEANSSSGYARFYVGHDAAINHSGGSPRDISLLHTLFELKVGPPDDEPDKYLIRNAAGQIPGLLQEQLGDDVVQQNSTVVSIDQKTDGATVGAVTPQGYQEYRAKAVIVAIPPWCAQAIRYSADVLRLPRFPAGRMQLMQRMAMGTIAKITCVYDTPWWRQSDGGLSGTALVKGRLIAATDDSGSLEPGRPGILTSFIQGDALFGWLRLSPSARVDAVIDDLVLLFGEEARNPVDYVETAWPQEPLIGGAYTAYLPPGGWTSQGEEIREPFGRISWAGTETAIEWYGYFDGAVSAGTRAAEEVITRWFS